MEVEAQDRPGLLKQIALALLQSKFKLDHARITTFGERAEDVFFITDRDNLPIPEGKAREQLVNTIKTRLDLSKYLDSGRLTQ
jgi:[protein-PII] uridylyltransferase